MKTIPGSYNDPVDLNAWNGPLQEMMIFQAIVNWHPRIWGYIGGVLQKELGHSQICQIPRVSWGLCIFVHPWIEEWPLISPFWQAHWFIFWTSYYIRLSCLDRLNILALYPKLLKCEGPPLFTSLGRIAGITTEDILLLRHVLHVGAHWHHAFGVTRWLVYLGAGLFTITRSKGLL